MNRRFSIMNENDSTRQNKGYHSKSTITGILMTVSPPGVAIKPRGAAEGFYSNSEVTEWGFLRGVNWEMGPGVLFQFFPFFATPRRKKAVFIMIVWIIVNQQSKRRCSSASLLKFIEYHLAIWIEQTQLYVPYFLLK